jgi:hypothetical protein
MSTISKTEVKDFQKITLDELNQTSSYLKRIDRKFLVTASQLKEILKNITKDFKVLEIA